MARIQMIAVRILRRPDGAQPGSAALAVGAGGATIGRSPDCDVVLEDPLRLVSRQHAQLLPQGTNAALLRCISASAPLSVNAESVAPGDERRVYVGDRLRIGGFELQIEAAEDSSRATGLHSGAASAAIAPLQMLDEILSRAPAASASASARTPGPAPVPPAGPKAEAKPSTKPEGEPRPKPRQAMVPRSLRPAQTPTPQPTLAAPPPTSAAAAIPAAAPVVAPAVAAAPATAARLRLDQWFDLDDAVADPLATGSPLAAVDESMAVRAAGAAPVAVAAAAPVPAAPSLRLRVPEAWDAVVPLAAAAVDAAHEMPVPVEQPGAAGDEALMRAFLQGAGLASAAAGPAWTLSTAWMQHLGRLLHAATEGTLALLRSRAVTKRSIRAEGTRIAVRENNPLKFAPNAAEALAMLLGKQGTPGFLEPVDAVRDAHNDLLVHQLAMVAGMRAAVFELISRLGPGVVEAQHGPPKGLARRFRLVHEAALWRRHRQQHEHLIANLDDDFEAVFGREFLLAYEAQSRLAAEQRLAPAERNQEPIRR